MNVLPVVPNTPEWMAVRALHDTASEAPAALGQHKYQSRTALLKQKATGLTEEVGVAKQALFDRGHQSEADARPLAEAIIGSDLYPVTVNLEIDGLLLLASLDGATMMEDEIFEHKLYSESLAADVRAGTLDPHYTIQMDQQLLVSGAKRCLFMTSDGTAEKMAWCWYESSPEKFDALIRGWKQFRADLANHEPIPVDAEVVGRTPETLPALHIEVTGMVTASNLAEYKAHALAVFSSINRDLTTDAHFADAEKTVKWCSDIETRLAAAKQHALSQTASIDALFRTIDDISAEARAVRLELDKLVKSRKEALRTEQAQRGKDAFAKHVAGLNARLGKPYMPVVATDFPGVIKGKKTVTSLRDAIDGELARAKIEANAIADKIQINLGTLRELAKDHAFLFADTAQIVLKAPDDLSALVKLRIAEHQAAEAKKEEAQRERIRAEEQEKAERAARAKVAEEQAAADKLAREAAAKELAEKQAQDAIEAAKAVSVAAPAAVIQAAVAMRDVHIDREATATPPTMPLGAISERLGFNVTSAFLASLGFEATTVKAAKLFHTEDFPAICRAIVRHIESVCELQAA